MSPKPLTRENVRRAREKRKRDEARFAKRRGEKKAPKKSRQQREAEKETDISLDKIDADKKAAAARFAEIDKIRAGTSKLKQAPQRTQAQQDKFDADRKAGVIAGLKEQQKAPSGFANVINVLGAAINPFSTDKIAATTDNRVFNTAAEYVANAPYVTALILTGLGGAARAAAGVGTRTVIGGLPATQTFGNYVANTKSAQLTASLLSRVMSAQNKKVFAYAAVAGIIGTYPWAEWALGEAKEGMIFNVDKAIRTGDVELMKLMREEQAEIQDIETWEQIQRFIPYVNIRFAFGEKAKALAAQFKVNDKILADEIDRLESGEEEGEDEFERGRREQERINKEKHDMEIAAIDHFNAEATRMLKLKEDAEDRDMKEDAKFWAREAEKTRKKEAEERQAIADFWTLYQKTKLRMSDNNRPSNLNFGLL